MRKLLVILLFPAFLGYGQNSPSLPVSGDSIAIIMNASPGQFSTVNKAMPIYTPGLNSALSYLKTNKIKAYSMADFMVYSSPNTVPLWQRERQPVPYYVQQQKFFIVQKKTKK